MLFIKNKSALSLMAEGGKILASCMELIENSIKPGMSTLELDKIAYKYIISNGAKPSFLGMYGFPNTLCTTFELFDFIRLPSPAASITAIIFSIQNTSL